MPTQRYFGSRREPADTPTLGFAHHKRRFGEVVFGGDLLHQLITEPGIEPIDHRRIATERALAERIDLMEG
ncbi:hypothetical protein D3C76_1755810 [compost metagenome]